LRVPLDAEASLNGFPPGLAKSLRQLFVPEHQSNRDA
jgi:hypothetical protein